MNISLKCKCGTVRGIASNVVPEKCNRVVCLCDDCQAFAHYLGHADALDPHGGTDIFQLAPNSLRITAGAEQLRCLRLSDKGMIRWFAGCCKTPIANTAPVAKMPFAGIIHVFMDHAADKQSRAAAVGPVRGSIHGRFGIGDVPNSVHPRVPVGMILRVIRFLASGFVNKRHAPSPFFDSTTGKPVVTPYILSAAERENLRPLCGPKKERR